jgi:lipid-A-disaccharide synthase-like uncharacterized protein
MMSDRIWLGIGFGGQALFAARFLLQWWQSERTGRSVVPVGFWYCSLGGGATLLIYAVHRWDMVFMMGQASGLLIYLRNLHLIRRERASAPSPAVTPDLSPSRS